MDDHMITQSWDASQLAQSAKNVFVMMFAAILLVVILATVNYPLAKCAHSTQHSCSPTPATSRQSRLAPAKGQKRGMHRAVRVWHQACNLQI